MQLARISFPILLLFVVSNTVADEVTEQIQAGLRAYEQGDYQTAVTELNFAVAEIQKRIDEARKKVLPDPLPGWTAEAPRAQSMAMMGMGGNQLGRLYRREGGQEQVEIEIFVDSPMVQMFAMMMTNPMMLQADPSTRLYRHGGRRGVLSHDAGADEWQLSFVLGNGRILLQLTGSGLKDEKPLLAYLDALDLDKVEALAR